MDAVTINVDVRTLEPGAHLRRATLATERAHSVQVPRASVSEIRPDLGLYAPTVTFSAIERALRAMGYLDPSRLGRDQVYYFSVA